MQTSYFPHDSNARNSDKLLPVRMKFGAEGYGIYFMLLERLRDEPNYMSVKDYNMLAFDLRVDAQKIKTIIEDFGLFAFTDDGKCFYSEGFMKRMNIKDSKSKARSEAGKKGAEKRWNKDSDSKSIAKPSKNNGNAMAMSSIGNGKKSKVNKSKVNKIKDHHQEDDDTYRNLITQFQQNFGINSTKPLMLDDLRYTLQDFTSQGTSYAEAIEIVKYALTIAVAHQGSSWSYVKGIIKSWLNNSLFDMEHIKDYQQKRNNSKQKYGKYNQKPKETGTDWSKVKAKKSAQNDSNALQERLAKLRSKENATN